MHDAGVGRHDRQIAKRGLAPAQEGIALFVADEFELGIELKRLRRAEFVHLHEWSITNSAGCSGLIKVGSPESRSMASRIAARSTTAGTPVKSCNKTRLG